MVGWTMAIPAEERVEETDQVWSEFPSEWENQ